MSGSRFISRMSAPAATLLAAALLMATAGRAIAQEGPGQAPPKAQVAAKIAKALSPSLVRLEYTLQYDKGEAPDAAGWRARCPNCGRYHINDASEAVSDERPVEAGAFVLAPDLILAADPMVHPRFVKRIVVIDGENEIPATPHAYAVHQNAILLRLEQPLKHATPLAFPDEDMEAPYFAVTYGQENGEWTVSVAGAGSVVATTERDRQFASVPAPSILVDGEARVAGVAMKEELPVQDESWKGSPLDWELIAADDMAAHLAEVERLTTSGVLRVTLNFRSPRMSGDSRQQMMMAYGNDESEATVRHEPALLVNDRQLLILAELRPNTTARLERIRVHLPDGGTASARFICSLRDYGALIAELDEPVEHSIPLSDLDIRDYRDELLLAADANLQGERMTIHTDHRRLAGVRTGWRRQHFPELPGETDNLWLFDRSGTLIALPISRRPAIAPEERWRRNGNRLLTATAYLAPILSDPTAHADPNNVPLSEQEENRLAWLGVELQPLDQELASVNNVSHLTRDGETGALITYIYPDSPADAAGIEPGYILLRLHVEDHPHPINVQLDRWSFQDEPFPWDQLAMVPEEYFEHIPMPWPAAENTFTRALTDIGFGKPFIAEFAHDGQIITHPFQVEQSPPHYGAAPQLQLDQIGLTLRDMTYEARRYYQRTEEDPGVIISRIEPGSRAAVAGLKPYEYITHINDQPVTSVEDIEPLLEDQSEVRMSVRRMAQGRIVQVRLPETAQPDPAQPEPAEQPSDSIAETPIEETPALNDEPAMEP